jgi:hypothetical protein
MSCTARLPLRTRQRAPKTERRSSRKTKQKKELGGDEDVLPGRRRHLHFTDHEAQMKTHDNEQWTNIIRLSQVSNISQGPGVLLMCKRGGGVRQRQDAGSDPRATERGAREGREGRRQ